MTHREICNGKLIIIDFDSEVYQNIERISKSKSSRAHVILESLGDGTYLIVKNRDGKIGDVVKQKEITKFMLRYGT